jgi:FkbM family methyltransferase
LIDPLPESADALDHWLSQYRGERIESAIGSAEMTTVMSVDPQSPWLSSIPQRPRAPPGASKAEKREVRVTTLDKLYEMRDWQPPFGLKIDSEGFELEVLEGASRMLEETQFVLAEVSVIPRFENGYTFAEFIAFMDERGFALRDCIDVLKARPSAPAEYMDALFRRV